MTQLPQGVTLTAEIPESAQGIFTQDALEFVASLHRTLNPTRQALLERRRQRWQPQSGEPRASGAWLRSSEGGET